MPQVPPWWRTISATSSALIPYLCFLRKLAFPPYSRSEISFIRWLWHGLQYEARPSLVERLRGKSLSGLKRRHIGHRFVGVEGGCPSSIAGDTRWLAGSAPGLR